MTSSTTDTTATGDGQQAVTTDATQAATGTSTTDAVAQTPPAADQQTTEPPKPAPPAAPKTFTQADLDRIVNERLTRHEESLGKKLAGLFGSDQSPADGKLTPEAILKQAQDLVNGTRQQANTTMAESLASAAKIKPERLDMFLGMVDLAATLKDVDPGDPTAVKAAIKAAVDAKAEALPEWRSTTAAAASGADRARAAGAKKTYTRAELETMTSDELAEHADDILAAQREGRIK